MHVSGLDLLVLEVNSIEESLGFYNGLLGFEVDKHSPDSEPPMATLRAGALRITLAQHLETMLKRGRGVNFFLGVADVDEYFRELTE
jgi:catechol 2,3-dioxygenase-like lactoylglutathione lyase family enzyme